MSVFIEQTITQVEATWADVNWPKVEKLVNRLQARIFRATQRRDFKRVRSLQKLLAKATSNKLLAIRRVTQENRGRNTPGVDGVVYDTPEKRLALSQEKWSLKYHRPQPVKRVYIPKSSGQRPLGIPTQKERAIQATVKTALEAEWEAKFEANSYGFRLGRSAHDAIVQIHRLLCQKGSSPWILDADIKGCFDNLSHAYLEEQIPTFKPIIRRWLKAGVIEAGQFQPTPTGSPQGGLVSPVLSNIALDGLERLFGAETQTGKPVKPSNRRGLNQGISLVRYADDFIVIAPTKERLLTYVLPNIKAFLAERGLTLNLEKTRIVHRTEGFNFLGFHIRYYNNRKLVIKPQKEKVQAHLSKIKQILTSNRHSAIETLIHQLNPLIWGWANYYRHCCAKHTFNYLKHRTWQMLWAWAKRRHPNKSAKWVRQRYFKTVGKRQWVFGTDTLSLRNPADMPIIRFVKVIGHHSPLNPELGEYWVKRHRRQVQQQTNSRLKQTLLKRQAYRWGQCDLPFTTEDIIHYHHIIPVVDGGSNGPDNRLAVHQHCHYQIHHRRCNRSSRLEPLAG